MGEWGIFHTDGVAGANVAGGQDDCHNPGFSDEAALFVPVQYGGQQTGLKAFYLGAGVSQAGDFDNSGFADVELGCGGEREKFDAACGDVLA